MNRLFRSPNRSLSSYLALAVFAVAYGAALSLVIAPHVMIAAGGTP